MTKENVYVVRLQTKDFDTLAKKLQEALSPISASIGKLQSQMNSAFNSLAENLGRSFAQKLQNSIDKNLTGVQSVVTKSFDTLYQRVRVAGIKSGKWEKSASKEDIDKFFGLPSESSIKSRILTYKKFLNDISEDNASKAFAKKTSSKIASPIEALVKDKMEEAKSIRQSTEQIQNLFIRARRGMLRFTGVEFSKTELEQMMGIPSNATREQIVKSYKDFINQIQDAFAAKPKPVKITARDNSKEWENYFQNEFLKPVINAKETAFLKAGKKLFDPRQSAFAQAGFRAFGNYRATLNPVSEFGPTPAPLIRNWNAGTNWNNYYRSVNDPIGGLNNINNQRMIMQYMLNTNAVNQYKEQYKTSNRFRARQMLEGFEFSNYGYDNAERLAALSDRNLGKIAEPPDKNKIRQAEEERRKVGRESIQQLWDDFKGLGQTIGSTVTTVMENLWTVMKAGLGIITTMIGSVATLAWGMKSWGQDILLTTERFRGYNIAMLGTLKTQANVDNVMKASMKVAENLPIGYEQVFQGTKAMTLISPLKPMFKDSENLEKNMKDVWDIVIALSQIEPEWGIQGALYSLRETLSGDFMSIKRRYEIPVDIMMTSEGKPLSEIKKDPTKLLGGLALNLRDMVPSETLELTANQFGAVMQKIQGYFDLFKKKIGEMGFYDAFVKDMQEVRKQFESFANSFDASILAKRLSNSFQRSWEAVKSFAKGAVTGINQIFNTSLKFDVTDIVGNIASITESITKLFQYVAGLANSQTLRDVVSSGLDEAKKKIQEIWASITRIAPQIYNFLKGIVNDIVSAVNWVTSFGQQWLSVDDILKGLFYSWMFGFGNIIDLVTGLGKVGWDTVNVFWKWDTSLEKIWSKGTGIKGVFESIGIGIANVARNLGSFYVFFNMIPKVMEMFLNSLELFAYTPLGRAIDYAKHATRVGKLSDQAAYEYAQEDYSKSIKSVKPDLIKMGYSNVPNSLDALSTYLSKNPKFLEDVGRKYADSVKNANVGQSGRVISGEYNYEAISSFLELANKLKGTDWAKQATLQGDLLKRNAELADQLDQKYGSGDGYLGLDDLLVKLGYISEPPEWLKSGFQTIVDAVSKMVSGGVNFTPESFKDSSGKGINLSGWSQENLNKLGRFNQLMAGEFGSKYNGGIYSANDKTHIGKDHGANLAADITALPDESYTFPETYLKIFQIGKSVGAKEILLGHTLENPKSMIAFQQAQDQALKNNIDLKSMMRFETEKEGGGRSIHLAFGGSPASGMQIPGSAAWDKIRQEAGSYIDPNTFVYSIEDFAKDIEKERKGLTGDIKQLDRQSSLRARSLGRLPFQYGSQVESKWQEIMGANNTIKIGQSGIIQILTETDDEVKGILNTYFDNVINSIKSNLAVAAQNAGFSGISQNQIDFAKKIANGPFKMITDMVMESDIFNSNVQEKGKNILTTFASNPLTQMLSGGLKNTGWFPKSIQMPSGISSAWNRSRDMNDAKALDIEEAKLRRIKLFASTQLKDAYSQIGEYTTKSGREQDIVFSNMADNMSMIASVELPEYSKSITDMFSSIREYAEDSKVPFEDMLKMRIEYLETYDSFKNQKGPFLDDQQESMRNAFLSEEERLAQLSYAKRLADSFAKNSPFLIWKNQLEDVKKAIQAMDYKNGMKVLNELRNRVPYLNRESKQAYYQTEASLMEYQTRSPGDALKLGMESATVEFKNWSEQFFDAGKSLVDGLASTFETGFFDFMTGKLGNLNDMFRSIGRSILNTIGQIVSKMAAITATKIILGMDINSGGGFGGGGGFAEQLAMGLLSGGGSSSGSVLSNLWKKRDYSVVISNPALQAAMMATAGGSGVAAAGFLPALATGALKTSGWGPLGLFGKEGLGNTIYTKMGGALGLGAIAAGVFLSQPGRLWGGIKSTKSLEQAQANYGDASQFVNDIIKRRLSDSEKYMYSGAYRGISSYALSGPTLRTWTSGDGWFKGPKEKHGAVDYTEQDRTLKGYYKLLEVSAEEDYLQRKKLNELRKTNEYEALKQEIGIRQGYLKMIEEQFATAVSLNQFEKQDELRDKIYEMKTSIDDLTSSMGDAFKTMISDMLEAGRAVVQRILQIGQMQYIDKSIVGKYQSYDYFDVTNSPSSNILNQMATINRMSKAATSTNTYVAFGSDWVSEIFGNLEEYLIESVDFSVFNTSTSTNRGKIVETINQIQDAVLSRANLENTTGQYKYIMENLFNFKDPMEQIFENLTDLKWQQTLIDPLDKVYGGAQAFADLNVQIAEQYQQVANQLQSWVDAGLLGKYVLKINNLSQDAFDSLAGVAREVGFRSSLTQSFKGFETMKELQDVLSQTISVGGSEQMKTFAGMTSSFSDPFDAYFNLQQELISNRIGSAENGSERYYEAQMDLFNLMAERAEHLKAKSEDSMRKLEELLDNIDQTMKLRIAEEAKTSKGDVVFLDLRTYSDMASEISKAIKNNDPQAMDLVDRLRKKLAGTSI